jgi:hypothetical protein
MRSTDGQSQAPDYQASTITNLITHKGADFGQDAMSIQDENPVMGTGFKGALIRAKNRLGSYSKTIQNVTKPPL